jgi:metal-sulfur cluster biosynthetic enzyme
MSAGDGAVDIAAVRQAAASVPDPEIRRTLADLDLLDDVAADGPHVTVRYHLTSPLCPSPFAIDIGREVRRRVEALAGVASCTVVIQDHFIAEEIARAVNEGAVTAAPAWL